MRGLKQSSGGGSDDSPSSHLLQMRGLKPGACRMCLNAYSRIFYRCVDWNLHSGNGTLLYWVASFTDAWIETDSNLSPLFYPSVASFTDAWIETPQPQGHIECTKCRIFYRCVDWNLLWLTRTDSISMSHLLQMRGLKQRSNKYLWTSWTSHLLQMRGLKHH